MVKKNRTPILAVISVVAIGTVFGFAFLLGGSGGLVTGNVSQLSLVENFRDLNCDAWNELAVTKNGQVSTVGSGRQGFNPSFDDTLLSVTDGSSEVDFMHVRLVLNCDGNFMKHPVTVQGAMDFQLCGDPSGARTTCFAGSDRNFQQLEGVAVSTATFFNVPIQQQGIPDDEPKVIWEGDISAFELERLFEERDGKIFFKSIMFPNLVWTFNHPTLGIFTASYNGITSNDPIISTYGQLSVIDETPTDTDGDGIPDTEDGCINQAEVVNGFQDSDGCPDSAPTSDDTDGDGIPDTDDQCVSEAEIVNGFQDSDGCPDTAPTSDDVTEEIPVDTDGDGTPDEFDLCITQVGSIANAGCPEPVIMEEDETAEVVPADIPDPLFTPTTPAPSTTVTQISPSTSDSDQRTFIIILLILGGLVAVAIIAIVQRKRK